MLWIPGPTHVRPEILEECARPAIGHRSAAMRELIARLDPGLEHAFGLEEGSTSSVGAHSVSATSMMEASLHGVGPRVLCIVNGAFSGRWAKIAGILGKKVTKLELPWGQVVQQEQLQEVLETEGPFDAVTVVASETSTGAATCLSEVSEVTRQHGAPMLMTDLVSYIAAARVDFDATGIDFAFAGVQKAFALPPGIAAFCVSERYEKAARELERRSFTLDPVLVLDGHRDRKTPATPCIPLYYALARQLEDITAGVTLPEADRHLSGRDAWQARFDKHSRMQKLTFEWADRHGLETFPARRDGSPGVTCLRAGSLDVARLISDLAEKDQLISNGYGDLKGKTFRIGHMGDHTEAGLVELLEDADEAIARQS